MALSGIINRVNEEYERNSNKYPLKMANKRGDCIWLWKGFGYNQKFDWSIISEPRLCLNGWIQKVVLKINFQDSVDKDLK